VLQLVAGNGTGVAPLTEDRQVVVDRRTLENTELSGKFHIDLVGSWAVGWGGQGCSGEADKAGPARFGELEYQRFGGVAVERPGADRLPRASGAVNADGEIDAFEAGGRIGVERVGPG
jgi:hypothetical protein